MSGFGNYIKQVAVSTCVQRFGSHLSGIYLGGDKCLVTGQGTCSFSRNCVHPPAAGEHLVLCSCTCSRCFSSMWVVYVLGVHCYLLVILIHISTFSQVHCGADSLFQAYLFMSLLPLRVLCWTHLLQTPSPVYGVFSYCLGGLLVNRSWF